MTGPEHFKEAERLIEAAGEVPSNHGDTNPGALVLLAEAQVHATLALAAATAIGQQKQGARGPGGGTGERGASVNAGPSFSNGPGGPMANSRPPLRQENAFARMEGWQGE
jgi:hypothetical protein